MAFGLGAPEYRRGPLKSNCHRVGFPVDFGCSGDL